MAIGTRSLHRGELLAVLGEIYRTQATGTLVLQREKISKFLYAHEGNVVFAASNAPEDKFTEILVEKGKLSHEQLAMAAEKKEGRTIGRTLVEMGFLGSNDLLEALVDQMKRIGFSVVNWDKGRAVFKPGVLPKNLAKLPLSTPRFILDTALAVEDKEWTAETLGRFEAPIALSKAEKEAALALPLAPHEIRLLESVNGERNAKELCELVQVDLFDGARFLVGMSDLGFLHIRQAFSPSPEPPAKRKKIDVDFLQQPGKEDLKPSPGVPAKGEPADASIPVAGKGEKEAAGKTEPQEQPRGGLPFGERTVLGSTPDVQPAPAPPESAEEAETPIPPVEKDENLLLPPEEEEASLYGWTGKAAWIVGIVAVVGVAAALAVWYFAFRKPAFVAMDQPLHSTPPPAQAASAQPGAEMSTLKEALPAAEKPKEPAPEPEREKAFPPPAPEAASTLAQNGSGITETEARALLRKGEYGKAAKAFRSLFAHQNAPFTIDIEIACQGETVAKGLAASGGDERFAILPYGFHGRSCFQVLWGFYPDRTSAEKALAEMPAFFRENASPRVASWRPHTRP